MPADFSRHAKTLVEQYGAGNSRSSSGGETRIIRSGYGHLAIYARWARASLPYWLDLEQQSKERLFVRTGALFLGNEGSWLADTAATLQAERVSAEWIEPADLARRYPQLRATGHALLEPEAGVLFARRAVQALAGAALDRVARREPGLLL